MFNWFVRLRFAIGSAPAESEEDMQQHYQRILESREKESTLDVMEGVNIRILK